MAMGRWNVGEKVPLVTSPTMSSPCSTGQPSRGTRLPSSCRPMRTGCELSAAKSFECLTADEFAAAEVHGEVQAGLNWVDRFAESSWP